MIVLFDVYYWGCAVQYLSLLISSYSLFIDRLLKIPVAIIVPKKFIFVNLIFILTVGKSN